MKIAFFMVILLFASCTKVNTSESFVDEAAVRNAIPPTTCDQLPTYCEDCEVQEANENDTTELRTILGDSINNPYSLSVMLQAYNNLTGYNLQSIQPSHYYIKINCNDINLVDQLESQDVEVFDHPLNRHVLQSGDYWPEAYTGIPEENIPLLYAVIENNFLMPAGMSYEILEPLFIPENNDVLEDEAFYLTGNMECATEYRENIRPARIAYYYGTNKMNPCDAEIEPCGGGGGSGTPPPGGHRKPTGQINYKSYISNPFGRIEADQPLKHVRVVGRRFFKIDKTFTDGNGNFIFTKSFPRKVTITVKFRTSSYFGEHSIRQTPRNYGFWKGRFPIKKNIGTYKGNRLSGLNYKFDKGDQWYKNKTRKWVAAVSLNSILEYDQFLISKGMNRLPNDIRLYLNQSANHFAADQVSQFEFIRRSTAPCLNQNKTFWQGVGNTTANTSLLGVAVTTAIVGAYSWPLNSSYYILTLLSTGGMLYNMKGRADIFFHYATLDVTNMTSTKVAISVGQQLGIVYLNRLTTINGYTDNFSKYSNHVSYSNPAHTYGNFKPFGEKNGNGSALGSNVPQLVAIWQMFAQHMAHEVADYSYGTGAESFAIQNVNWQSTATASSSKQFLEGFTPNPQNISDDYFSWIPIGLINDLMDVTNESTPVNDNVSGLTYSQLYSILTAQPGTMQEFKNLVISFLPGQTIQINNLFNSYGY